MGVNIQPEDRFRAQLPVPGTPSTVELAPPSAEIGYGNTVAEYRSALPLRSEEPRRSKRIPSPPAPASLLAGKTRVLVVDDECDVADEMAAYLERHEFSCLVAASAEQAFNVLRNDLDIAIVVTDVCMGDIDGN